MIFFQDLWWFMIFFAASYGFHLVFFRSDTGNLQKVFLALGFFGVIIHELSHFIACKMSGVPTRGMVIGYRRDGEVRPHGSVGLQDVERISFMQGFMVGLAPLFVCTWACLLFLDLTFTSTAPFIQILSFLGAISVFIGATPSHADIHQVSAAFSRDPPHSLYQVTLVLISGILAFFTFTEFLIIEALALYPFLIYVFVALFYFTLKYSLKGLNSLQHAVFHGRSKTNEIKSFKRYRRSSLKPKVPWKTKHRDDGQW